MAETFVIVGKLGRPRGVNGEIFVTPTTDYPERFIGLTEIYVFERSEWVKRHLDSAKLIGNRPVLHFTNVTTPEEAARLTNRDLGVPREQAVELPENTYFIFDLVECDVYNTKTGQQIGKIIDVEKYPANDVYLIETSTGLRFLCPVVKQFVKKIDIAARRVEIDPTGLDIPE